MTVPDDLAPDMPHDISGWPATARAQYFKMCWSRAQLVAVVLDEVECLDEERIEKIRGGHTRLTMAELSAIATELRVDLSR